MIVPPFTHLGIPVIGCPVIICSFTNVEFSGSFNWAKEQ